MDIKIEHEYSNLVLSDFSIGDKSFHIGIVNFHDTTSMSLSKKDLIKLRNGIDELLKSRWA